MSHDPIISHGRGGAGNIDHDDQTYADGEIVRQGPVGDQGDGAYSAGRGGAGNISTPQSPSIQPRQKGDPPGDVDIVPETAMREEKEGRFHTGRGGGGNVGEKGEGHEGLAEKAKHFLGGGGEGGK